ncbi:ABC transporter permease [Fulvivirga sedimenti]|uniref:ABC transporter permease n=1 Tax=Fulvivirga sedimenti TaxID=2879465 RepID=A0A9X1HVL0_9BACT|nr:FtsX-like permease family protein [Fulvivirga sedimenti]MCA6078476.1 ABC transporter permease [Fulvivirga sedimenti]
MTNWKVILSISKTHLLSRLKQTSIAALGVTFGISTFIILVSFMTGLNNLLDGLILDRTPHVHLYNELAPSERQPVDLYEGFSDSWNVVHSVKPRLSQERIHNALPIITYLREHKKVLGATPQVQINGFYIAGSIQLNGVLNGVNIGDEISLFNIDQYIVNGDPFALDRIDNGIILGAGAASKLSVNIGDRVQVMSANSEIFPLKIVGIYQSGLAEIDNVQSYISIKSAQRIQGEGTNYITDINIKLTDIELSPSFSKQLESMFNVTAIDINTANAQFETGTSIRNIITYAVSVTLLIVAGFGIYNILNMVIYEKMNDIAILKATGFSGRDVKLIFMSQAMLIGLAGGFLGLVFGHLIAVAIDHTPFETQALPTVDTFPVNFNPVFYLIGVIFALTATFFAGYLPARRAEKIDPVEIIRGQ